jgi:hypothetical protein
MYLSSQVSELKYFLRAEKHREGESREGECIFGVSFGFPVFSLYNFGILPSAPSTEENNNFVFHHEK